MSRPEPSRAEFGWLVACVGGGWLLGWVDRVSGVLGGLPGWWRVGVKVMGNDCESELVI